MAEPRPRIKIPLTGADRILEGLSIGWLAILWISVFIFYPQLPEQVPSHINAGGKVDDYSDKLSIITLPAVCTLIWALLTWLNRYPHWFNYTSNITAENAFDKYRSATRMIRVLKLSVVVVFSLIVFIIFRISFTGSDGPGAWLLPVIILVILVPVVYFVVRSSGKK